MAQKGRSLGAVPPSESPIACESCRNRKRKCDRNLPFCLQCTHEPSKCHYPEQNKRGVPSGFINRLEARLAETEAALFRVLRETSNAPDAATPEHLSEAATGTSRASRGNKMDKVAEWEHLPLQSLADIQAWYRWKSSGSTSAEAEVLVLTDDYSNTPGLADQQIPEADELFSLPQTFCMAQEESSTPSVSGASGASGATTASRRAKGLLQSHRDIYF